MKPTTFLAIRRPLVWLIAVAIVAYGYSATVVQLLGPAHRHEASAQTSSSPFGPIGDMVRDLKAWRADLHARWLPHEAHEHSHPHSHGHGAYERHHHDLGDDSMVMLDGMGGGAAAADAGTAGSAALPLALAPQWHSPSLARLARTWPMTSADRWTDAALRLSERPPRT